MAESPLLEEQRENWGSRAGFVLAAIGSAVGLGNLWGFPYKLYSYGGGAFLIPYVIAMMLIGIPLLIAEFSLGHLTQRATPDAFGRAHRRFAFVGWWQILLSFVIVTYYAVILAYCGSFLYYSVVGIVKGALPWAGEGIAGVQKAKSFFFSDYLRFNESFSLGRLQWHIILALVITWAAMYLCIFRGVRTVSKVVLYTVPIPWLMLLILTVRGLTLPGAMQGLEYYLEPNWTRLANPATWRWAFGQMFFSMSLAFGIMITYASFLHRKSDLNNNAAIIGLADLGTSFVAGLAVFATLGAMAYASAIAGHGVPVDAVAESGPSLVFVAFPYALAQLPHAAWFSAVFFCSLILLGIDSAFSITESVLASVVDKTGWSRGKVLIGITLVGLVIGLLFCTQGGLSWLGTFDDFINGTWGITLTALLECFVLGWLFRLRRLRAHANERSDWNIGRWWDWTIRLVIPVILAALFAWSLFDSLSDPKGYAFQYECDEVSVEIPAADKLPPRPVLELAFVSPLSDDPEHAFTLDETQTKAPKKAEAMVKGWSRGTGTDGKALDKTFQAADLAGTPLTFATAKITPRTAYTVRYRWNSRPETDAKTGLPIAVPEDKQPDWNDLGSVKTTSRRAGLHLGNFVGLLVMGLAPILAIVIAVVRIRRDEPTVSAASYSDPSPRGRGVGIVSVLLGLGGLVGSGVALVDMLGAAADVRVGVSAAEGGGLHSALGGLAMGGVGALLAVLLGGAIVTACERRTVKASIAARLGAGAGVLGLGICGGLGLALAMMTVKFPSAAIEYDNQLSLVSYIILAVMLALIVVGLGWCFYRAIKAAGGAAPEQEPEATE